MNDAVINIVQTDRFQVLNSSGVAVTGLVNGNFTKELWRPDGTEVSGSITVTVTELDSGFYEASFTPNVLGYWSIAVYNATHIPEGVYDDFWVKAADFAGEVDIKRILGLTQENQLIDTIVYNADDDSTSSRLRIFPSKQDTVDETNVLATYTITVTYADELLTSYRMVKE